MNKRKPVSYSFWCRSLWCFQTRNCCCCKSHSRVRLSRLNGCGEQSSARIVCRYPAWNRGSEGAACPFPAPRGGRSIAAGTVGLLPGRGGCSAPASLCHLTVDLPSPPLPSPLSDSWRWVSIRAPPHPENSVAYIELSLKKKENSRQTEGAVYRGGGGAGGESAQRKHPCPLFPPLERKHQTPVVPGLSTPDRSLLTPDAGHRRLSGLIRCIASPAAVLSAPSLRPA